MTLPAESTSWPPEDAGELLNRWRGMGSPEIVLNPGVSIIDLDKWFDPMVFPWPSDEELNRVRAGLGLETAPAPEPQKQGEQEKLF